MSLPFITRNADKQELTRLQLMMSTFTDGSGYEKNTDGSTRPGWRDFERIVAELLEGDAPEGKSIFDIVILSTQNENCTYGVSVKSKGFNKRKFNSLLKNGRVYMELCNSPAKLWEPLTRIGINEDHFRRQQRSQEVGDSILTTVHSWYSNSGVINIDINKSVHLTVSYQKQKNEPILFQLHTFSLEFPSNIVWKYKSKRCLSGYDPSSPEEVLFDWYGLSGGQLKYYPKANTALFSSKQFPLIQATPISISDKARQYWPDKWEV